MLPDKILLETEDGEYILAEYKESKEIPEDMEIPVYKQIAYYHTLETALKGV